MQKIFTGADIARRDGLNTMREWIMRIAEKCKVKVNPVISGEPIAAQIDYGRWIAKCECGGAEYVDPDDAVLFCFSCNNAQAGGAFRPVQFPENRAQIEAEILRRPVVDGIGATAIDQAMRAKPVHAQLSRCWKPGETVEDLKKQRAEVNNGI